jgi:hypothetical protein
MPDHIKKLVCNFYKVPNSALIVSKRGETNIQRDVAIYLLRRHTNKTLAETGKYFEITNYSTVSTVVEKIKSQIKTDCKLNKTTGAKTEQKSTADLTPHQIDPSSDPSSTANLTSHFLLEQTAMSFPQFQW